MYEIKVTLSINLNLNLNKNFQRPSARELLRHQFIRKAKRTSYLVDLIERHNEWKSRGGNRNNSGSSSSSDEDTDSKNGTIDGWNFATVKNYKNNHYLNNNNNVGNNINLNNNSNTQSNNLLTNQSSQNNSEFYITQNVSY